MNSFDKVIKIWHIGVVLMIAFVILSAFEPLLLIIPPVIALIMVLVLFKEGKKVEKKFPKVICDGMTETNDPIGMLLLILGLIGFPVVLTLLRNYKYFKEKNRWYNK